MRLLLIAIMGYCFPAVWAGNNYAINKYVIASGGGISSANGIEVQGTIAQMTTGQSNSNNHTLHSGFWYQTGAANDIIFENGFNE